LERAKLRSFLSRLIREAEMKRSPEIEKLIRDTVAAYERGDAAFIERTTSKQHGLIVIGTDANEYARDYEPVALAVHHEIDSAPQWRVRIGEIHAYEHGDVGWADGTGSLEGEGQSVEVRSTSVFLREEGEWRTVQSHSSIGVPNEKMFDPMFQRHKAAT
jgi:ketosteroid isomerase-like protein